MPAYQGGKARIGRRIHDVITIIEDAVYGLDEDLPTYFEPFVGMGGVIRHFGKDDDRELIATDVSPDMIMMWRALQRGWEPPITCSREKFNKLKHSKPSAERAFVGCVASWGGNWFHSYRLDRAPSGTNYMAEGKRSILAMKADIQDVQFLPASSFEEHHPVGMTIYADPPYVGNKLSTATFRNFDHEKFWQTMREWSKDNLVVVSESQAPKDFKKVWSARSTVALNKGKKAKSYNDNLYVHKDIYNRLSRTVRKEIRSV